MAFRLVGEAMISESDRASRSVVPLPRSFSLKKAVLLVPSVILARRTELQ